MVYPQVFSTVKILCPYGMLTCKYMWQSRVEIEGYSVEYFERIAVFEVPYR